MNKLQTQGVHHITLVGADRQTSIDFWEGVLGMPFVFEQPNLDNARESHIYFDPGDGRLITIFTQEDRKPLKRRTPTEPGCVHHIAFNVSRAVFMQAGAWLRPEYYALAGKSKREAVREEAAAVRASVGVIDVGTLGKMEISGPDAAAFLERVYTGRFANMKVGTTRYALMVDESGVIIDDGVVARLGDERFYFTTTTTGSANVYREMTRLNVLWQMKVGIVNATGAEPPFIALSRSRMPPRQC